MPQYRKLNVNILSSPDVDAMPNDFVRLSWTWLPLICTRDGTGLFHPTLIKSQLFPMRRDVSEQMIEDAFNWFETAELITVYEVDGRWYYHVCNFAKYQGVTIKESPSPYPQPPPDLVKSKSVPSQELVQTNSVPSLPLMNMNIESEYESEDDSESVEPFRILFDAFLEASGISELMLVGHKAVDEITGKWIPSDVTPAEVVSAVKALQDKGYNITGPWSITNSINMIRSGKKGSANKPLSEKYKLPEDYDDEEEYEDDDEPEVDTKWTTFLEQHVKDIRWRNLLEYGGYDVNGKVVIHVPEASMAEAKSRFGSTLDRYYLGNARLEGVAI